MKAIKIIAGVLLIIGTLGSLMSFFKQVSSYEAPELIGHLLAIVLISWFAYLLLKPSKKA
ncbi:hypothetical protein [Lutibacter sp.]|uniref:hypothetical protein n=1 Tax=Lutibacter sp. TaxID=1925666 RepID=UPI0027359BEE|nr:hypothetical protein [Lutibacter sp.]MDP3314389.1 hypothetical protein [Lutibacter sp.]